MKIIPLKNLKSGANQRNDNVCVLKQNCPVGQNIPPDDDPFAAIYSFVLRSGKVLRGAHEVRPAQVRALLLAIDQFQFELHNLYNRAVQDEVQGRTGMPLIS